MEEEITFIDIFKIIKKRFSLVAILCMLGLVISGVFTFFIATPTYSSTTQILVNRTQTGEVIQQSDINTNLQLINTYKDIIKGPVILDSVLDKLNLDITNSELSSKIEIGNKDNSQVFSLTITDVNPYSAAEIANTVASTFQDKIDEIMYVDNVTIISTAIPEVNPVSPSIPLNIAIGMLFGIILGVLIAFLYEYMDKTVKDEKFIMDVLKWTNLGSVLEMSANEITATRITESQVVRSKHKGVSRRV